MCRVYSGILVVIWILAPYSILQHVEVFPVLWMPQLSIDKFIAVNFHSMWFYYSYYLLLGLVGLTVEKKLFIRYLYTVGWVTAVSHAFFLFMPNGVSREDIAIDSAPWFYQILAIVDQPRNAFPSLHASLSVVAAIAFQSSAHFPKWSKPVVWLWVLGIFWSTIALRQHVSLDLLGGMVLAGVMWWMIPKTREMKYHGV